MNVYQHRRSDASIALYIDGNLQFDSRDEAIYHESLALPALSLAKTPKSVLICGGGDGLALREVLRFPGIERVLLIDCSEEVLQFSRTELKELNQNSLADPRVTVAVADALTYAFDHQAFDVIICDFTFPTTQESSRGFTLEWYQKLKEALSDEGILAVNAVSPQNTASAFACIVGTLRAAGLRTLPYRVCIPSFRDHGYGAWGFVLASRCSLTIRQLASVVCPVETRQANIAGLSRGARFSAQARISFATSPVNREAKPVLQSLLLNPSTPPCLTDAPPDFPNLVQQVEISHPYHSRGMIEALAEQVIGSLHSIDLRKLVDELTARAKRLPIRIAEELRRLREYLSQSVLDLDLWGKWASRLFATLVLVITIANSISPDPAFAKGGEGLGHASFSRGFGTSDSFGGGNAPPVPITGRGFASTYGHEPVDIYGYHYSPRMYFYDGGYGGGYGGGGSRRSSANVQQLYQPQAHKPLFVLDDDLLAMENGDFVIPLSENVFLVVARGNVNLMDSQGGKPLLPIFAEPKLFDEIRKEVAAQGTQIDAEVNSRRDWLSWAGWTSTMFSSVRADTEEFSNLQDLQRRLNGAIKNLGYSSESASIPVPEDAVELFVGCHILSDNRLAFYGPGGSASYCDGTTFVSPGGAKSPISPALKSAIAAVLRKMVTETQKDIASDKSERNSLHAEANATQMDLSEYQSIQAMNGMDPTYQVDYGTDSVPVSQAIQMTMNDLSAVTLDLQLLDVNQKKSETDFVRFQAVLGVWSQ